MNFNEFCEVNFKFTGNVFFHSYRSVSVTF